MTRQPMTRRTSPRLALLAAGVACAQTAGGEPVTIVFDLPTLDRWNYPFNQSPGTRPVASVFGAFEEGGLSPLFDNRDAQFLVGFSTAAQVEPGLGPGSYTVSAATLTMMVASHNTFRHEVVLHPWQSYLPPDHPEFICPVEEVPCGKGGEMCCPNTLAVPPLELYGVGFRNGFTPATYQENTPYSPLGPFGKDHRTAYPIDRDMDGEPIDVSNNVDVGFDPWPLAIGTTTAVAPGQMVPQGAIFTFEIDVADSLIQAYLREAVNEGVVHFMVASLYPAAEDGSGSFPEFYAKENLLVQAGIAQAARLTITIQLNDEQTTPGDLNGDGAVDVQDLLILLSAWGTCADPDDCPADLNGDGGVDVMDLLILLSNWG